MSDPKFKFALREDLKDEKQFLPFRAEPKSSGWDVRAAMPDRKYLVIHPFEHIKIPLGFRGFCPEGWWYQLKPRSSSFAKKNLHALYGTVDETYEGELIFACQYIPSLFYMVDIHDDNHYMEAAQNWSTYCRENKLQIDFGDAIGQIIPVRREEMIVEEISNGDYAAECLARSGARGDGGFGSTSK